MGNIHFFGGHLKKCEPFKIFRLLTFFSKVGSISRVLAKVGLVSTFEISFRLSHSLEKQNFVKKM